MAENIIVTKTYSFALMIVRACRCLHEQREYILSKQLLRSGTSIGADVLEATQGESKAGFIHKMSIALKETVESSYWIRLLRDSNYIEQNRADELLVFCEEIRKIISSIIKTSKERKL